MMPGSELYKGNYIMKVVPRNLGINYTKTRGEGWGLRVVSLM
jgi:hypothetical protein